MRTVAAEDTGSKQFAAYVKAGISADDLEDMYAKAHAAIRANPSVARDPLEKGRFGTRSAPKATSFAKKRFNRAKTSLAQRKDRIRQKLTHMGIKSCADNL